MYYCFKEAKDLLKQTLQLKKTMFGDYSEQVADSYKLTGSIILTDGQLNSALKLLRKVCVFALDFFLYSEYSTSVTTHTGK